MTNAALRQHVSRYLAVYADLQTLEPCVGDPVVIDHLEDCRQRADEASKLRCLSRPAPTAVNAGLTR